MIGKRKELTTLTKNYARSRPEAVSHSFTIRNTRRENSRASSHEDKVDTRHHERVQGRERGHDNLKWNTDLIETMELEHVMSQAAQDRYDGETHHDNEKLKLTNVRKCSGRNTHQGATRKLISQTSRVEEVCL